MKSIPEPHLNTETAVAGQWLMLIYRRIEGLIVLLLLGVAFPAKAATLSASGGFQPGLFTWLSQMQVSGSGFTPTVPYLISLFGPLDLPGVTPAQRALQTLFADGTGNLNGTVNIPYVDLATVNAHLTKIPGRGAMRFERADRREKSLEP